MNKTQMINELRFRNSSDIAGLANSTVQRKWKKEDLERFLLKQLDWDEAIAMNLIDEETLRKGEEHSLQAFTANGDEVVFEAELPPAELPGLRTVESWDKEQEHFVGYDCDEETGEPVPVWDDPSQADDPWFCLSGNQMDPKPEISEFYKYTGNPNPFYSAAKPIQWRKQRHNYVQGMIWIFQNRDNEALLRAGWKKFWRRYYSEKKNNNLTNWMWQRHIKSVRAAFEAQGVGKAREK